MNGCIYENRVKTLHQITHIDFDFATPVGHKITLKQKKRRRLQEKEDERVEEKSLTFLLIFIPPSLATKKALNRGGISLTLFSLVQTL